MKKFIALLMAMIMVCACAACGSNKPAESSKEESSKVEESSVEESSVEESSVEESSVEESSAQPSGETLAQKVIADFTAKAASFDDLTALAQDLMAADYLDVMMGDMDVEPGLLNGFDGEVTGFKAGHQFGPMMGPIPFIAYVFTVDDGVKPEDFIETLKKSANLRWNVCTSADDMQAAFVGNTVCFVMSPVSFDE